MSSGTDEVERMEDHAPDETGKIIKEKDKDESGKGKKLIEEVPDNDEWMDLERDEEEKLKEAEAASNEDSEEKDKEKDKEESQGNDESEEGVGKSMNNIDKDRKKWPCGVCNGNVGSNSLECKGCDRWIHGRCSEVNKGDRFIEGEYRCTKCKPPTTPKKKKGKRKTKWKRKSK